MNARWEAPRRVLLVEDNAGDADMIRDLLDRLPSRAEQIEHVLSLQQAVSRLREAPADTVLLDLNLPDGVGEECVSTIRTHASGVPIIVLTGSEDDALALRCISAGAQDYLAKSGLQVESMHRAIGYAAARVQMDAERQRADRLHARLAAIVDSSYDAIVSSTVDGVVTTWNKGAERTFGYALSDAVGRPVREVIRQDSEDDDASRDRRVFQPRRDPHAGGVEEVVRFHKDGRALTLSVVTSLVRDAAGEVLGLAAILRDITESKRRDAELQRLTDSLAARERRMTALTARLRNLQEEERSRISREVHDGLGQLLTGLKLDIRWMVRKLAAGATPAELAPKLAEADSLVDQTVAAVQRIALELRPSALDALGLAAAVRDEARRFEARTGVRTDVDIRSESLPDATVATAMFRILQELLTNITRHAEASRVRIDLFEQDAAWVLRVADNGVGVPPDIASGSASLGLLGMTERAESVGGSFLLERASEGGTVGSIIVPQPRA